MINAGFDAVPVEMDLSSRSSVVNLIGEAEKYGEISMLVNAAGGTYFDMAYPYHGGNSECAFREAVVKRYPRERFTVTDKLPIYLIQI